MSSILPKPQYKVRLEGVSFVVQFDTNINETKRGLKMRFYPQEGELDVRKLSSLANKLTLILQKQFSTQGLQVDRDLQVQDPTVVGFIIPLSTLSDFIVNRILKGQQG